MKVATLLHKVNYPLDPEVLPAEVVLEMVTLNAAKAMGLENEIGSLEKGKKADVILVDLKKPHLIPVFTQAKTQRGQPARVQCCRSRCRYDHCQWSCADVAPKGIES